MKTRAYLALGLVTAALAGCNGHGAEGGRGPAAELLQPPP